MALIKDDILSVEILTLDNDVLYKTDKNFDFPKIYDESDNLIENFLMIKGKRLPELEKDEYIYVVCHMKNGDRIRYKTFVSVSSYCQMNIILRPDQAQVMEERRRFFKIKTCERGVATFITRGEDTIRLDPPVYIIVKDINIGGFLFTVENSSFQFEKGDKVMTLVRLGQEKLEAIVEILRSQQTEGDPAVNYGSRFVHTTFSQEEFITRYIYDIQQAKRMKNKEDD